MSDKIIVMNRGDTYYFTLTISDSDGNTYLLHHEDAVYFGVMNPHQRFEDALIKKKLTADDMNEDGSITISLKPADTLDLYPGTYYYAVKLHRVAKADDIDDVITVINKTKLIIND